MRDNKWYDAEKKKPRKDRHYDMCLLDIGKKVITGWWNGFCWDGFRYKGEEVVRWRYGIEQ